MKARIKDALLQKDGTWGFNIIPDADNIKPFTVYLPVEKLKDNKGEFLTKSAMLAAVEVEVAKITLKSEFSPIQLIGLEVDIFGA